MTGATAWIIFSVLIIVLLSLDLFVFNRKDHVIKFKEAMLVALFWIGLAMAFNLGVYFVKGPKVALEFLTAYLIEESLSVDNLFVFIMIFSVFGVHPKYQHRVLFWGIIGAIVLRALFIFAGVALIERFHWIVYVFGGFLIFTGIKMAIQKEGELHPENNPMIKIARKLFPVDTNAPEGHFFSKVNGRLAITPLFIVLLVVETTDVIFALDSIPAVLSISRDPFIVYTSNVFAILGLRALFFALSGAMTAFHFLKFGLAVILTFVGVKMTISHFYHVPIAWALGVVASVLAGSILLSMAFPKKKAETVSIDGK
jgi:tellurite resistance protein TerC